MFYISNWIVAFNIILDPVIAASNYVNSPDSKVHGANMGPIWGRQDPGGAHVGPMNFAIWEAAESVLCEILFDVVKLID